MKNGKNGTDGKNDKNMNKKVQQEKKGKTILNNPIISIMWPYEAISGFKPWYNAVLTHLQNIRDSWHLFTRENNRLCIQHPSKSDI